MPIHHDTLVFERRIDATPAEVFTAYADRSRREAWSAPSDASEVKIDAVDFRTGGSERGRCGSKGDLRWATEVAYHAVEANRRIVFTEALKEGASILTVALIAFDLQADGERGTKLAVTDQIASFIGPEGVQGHKDGYRQALDNLARCLARGGVDA